ncbi:flagellin [Mesorhizobium sp. CAU 1741]|uniref:flagellin N-terminal helical domain-containing protein n=1 Tax=Mesorhizobium sp. CAU 1741 TaxID=3140366 RepID=UPI00325BE5D4
MSSIMTNAAAMTALQTLKSTNAKLDLTQGRISTGFRVAEAAHNAAYWSIATTMRSDNSAMSTVRDALGLGAAQVDIAYTAMDVARQTLDTIKSKIVAASQPDVDKTKIQEEITQLQNDLKTYAKSATFSGGNWLDVPEAGIEKVVASFIRTASGSIALGTIDIDTSKVALFNADPDSEGGILGGVNFEDANFSLAGLAVGESTPADFAGPTSASLQLGTWEGVTLNEGSSISFEMTYAGATHTITLDGTDGGLDLTAGGDLVTALEAAINNVDTFGAAAGFNVTVDGDGLVSLEGPAPASAADTGLELGVANLRAEVDNLDILSIDIRTASEDQLAGLLNAIDGTVSAVTTAASDLGAIKTRIASQQDFVSKIMDAVDRGVGQLVDADMEEESTKLQALQVQQQLGIQALSIANGNAQNILALFQN